MTNAILIHGLASKGEYYDTSFPTGSNSHWFPWLSKQLIVRDIHTVALEMPNGYYPQYDVWKKELERFDISENTILVGHSLGGGFLVRWLSENDVRAGKVVLVAPWMGLFPDSEPKKRAEFDESFFDFSINPMIAKKTEQLTIIASSNDVESVQDSVTLLKNKLIDYRYVELPDKGHFTLRSLGGEAFPELLEEALA